METGIYIFYKVNAGIPLIGPAPKDAVFGDGASKEVIKVKSGHKDGALSQ